jgi:hypothetical protein
MVIRICSAPGTGRFVDCVAFQCIRTAMGKDAWRLFGQIFRWKHYLGLESDLVPGMLTITDLAHIPLLLCHSTPPDFAAIVRQIKDACQ